LRRESHWIFVVAVAAMVLTAGCEVERIVSNSAFGCGSGGPCEMPDATTRVGTDVVAGPPVDAGVDAGPVDPPDAGQPMLTLGATMLDFGRTVVGSQVSAAFQITNPEATPMVASVTAPSGDPTFAIISPADPSQIAIAPGQTIAVEVEFRPSLVGRTGADLVVELCARGCEARVALSGVGALAAIACTSAIDFGFANPQTCAVERATCSNTSDHPASLQSLTIDGDAVFGLVAPVPAQVLAPGQALDADVTFCPTVVASSQGSLRVAVVHPDPARQELTVALRGEGGGADVRCDASRLDFGILPAGGGVTQKVSCRNEGSIPMALSSASISSGSSSFSVSYSLEGMSVPPPTTVRVGTDFDVVVEYAPALPGTHTATVVLETDDPDSGRVSIGLRGQSARGVGCALQVGSMKLEHGLVIPGRFRDASASVTNVGTGDCALSVGEAPGGAFTLLSPPVGAGVVVAAQASLHVRTRFAPLGPGVYTSTVGFHTNDPAATSIRLPMGGTSSSRAISVQPSVVSFGAIPVGCAEPAVRRLTVTNNEPTSITLQQATVGTGPFSLVSPATPITLDTGDSIEVVIGYAPTMVGGNAGRLLLSFGRAGTLQVPLDGEGSPTAGAAVAYPPRAQPAVDILLVVDDLSGATVIRNRLRDAAEGFVQRLLTLGADFHIGVTTTDATAGSAGRLRGIEKVIDSATTDPGQVLRDNLALSLGIAPPAGLFAASQAVNDPAALATDNAGFSRSNAELAVVFLTRRRDESAGTAVSYLTALSNRLAGVPGAVTAFAVTGGVDGCSGNGVNAFDDDRYTAVAGLSGGASFSVCDVTFDATLRTIADTLFVRASTYELPARPAPGSMRVEVDGVFVPPIGAMGAAWGLSYDPPQLVFFDAARPADSAMVTAEYDVFCVAPTCGDSQTDVGEQCDDGDMADSDACPSTCWAAHCGDGFTRVGLEQCDDLNNLPGDGCSASCLIEGCGNGTIEPPEACDMGPLNSDSTPDACRTDCTAPRCHDGVIDGNEQCDDGNLVNTDACVGTCADARCGDGFVRAVVEECDDGNTNDNDDCANNCTSNLLSFVVGLRSQSFTLSSGTALTFNDDDDGEAQLAIGFPFLYLGRPVTTVWVSTNGFIDFEGLASDELVNTTFPSASLPNELVAWWWDDLDVGRQISGAPTPAVTTAVTGSTGNRVRHITYRYIPAFDTGDSVLLAEIRLFELGNAIEIHYGPHLQLGPMVTPWGASAGWESSGGTRGGSYLGCTPVCRSTDYPVNRVYRLIPR